MHLGECGNKNKILGKLRCVLATSKKYFETRREIRIEIRANRAYNFTGGIRGVVPRSLWGVSAMRALTAFTFVCVGTDPFAILRWTVPQETAPPNSLP